MAFSASGRNVEKGAPYVGSGGLRYAGELCMNECLVVGRKKRTVLLWRRGEGVRGRVGKG